MATCSHCGGGLPEDAIFCPSCGRRTDAPPIEPRDIPIDVQHAKPRYFGLGPPIFVLSLAFILLVVGVVLLATGSVAGGLIAIGLAICLLPVVPGRSAPLARHPDRARRHQHRRPPA